MKDYTTDNPVFSDKIPLVERADLVNYENKTKAEKQLLQNDLVLKKQMDTCLGENGKDGNLGLAEGIKAGDLVGAVNEVFTLGSEKKKQLVENLTALGITASTDETWEMLLNKVLNLINTSNDTVTAETLLSGYTAHNAAGAKITGTLADKTGTADHSAEASIDATNKRLKLKVPATAKYSVGNYLYAAYATIANLIGLTAAKLVKGNTILGITGNNNNMDTSGADAAAGDVLAGKKAGVKGSLITGTLADKTGTADYNAEASMDATNKRIKLKVPTTGKYSVGNYLYAAYATIANLIGLTAAKLVKGNTVLGITGDNNNMDTSGADAAAGDILSGKKAGVKGSLITGTMADRGAWIGETTGKGNVAIPGGRHNGQGYVSGVGAYNAGVSAADGRVNADSANYKGGYNAGVSATKKGTAGAGDVLAGKTFTNSSSVGASGTMVNKGNTTQDATATQDDIYTYLTVPVAGYYDTASKLRTKNSNLQSKYAITVGRQADASASAGFTGYQVVSSDASGNGSVKHGYAGFTLKYQWELSENGGIYIKVSGSGGYGTVSADFTLAPL